MADKCKTCWRNPAAVGSRCQQCHHRHSEGLVHYVPSNGTEGMMFFERCERCIHAKIEDGYVAGCAHGIANKLIDMMAYDLDHPSAWHSPDDLDPARSPALCKRFTHRDEPGAKPYTPPDPNQLTFEDVLEVKEPALAIAALLAGEGE